MSFPHHDRFWSETADFVATHRAAADSVLAPDLFWWRFERMARYRNTVLRPGQRYDWAILHKGELQQLAAEFLPTMHAEMRPVFANEVFVVWTRRADLPGLAATDPHLAAYFEFLNRPAAPPAAGASGPPPLDRGLPDRGIIEHFEGLTPRALRVAMDAFYANGGYRYETLRDKTYFAELDRCVRALLRTGPETRILDIACGNGRMAALVPPGQCRALAGIDISPAALAHARGRWPARLDCRFAAMDAANLAFADGIFDVAAFIDAAEHVLDIERVLDEAARVLRPGGTLIVSAANRDSLNQVITRKLGYPGFLTNYQHIREFTLDEFEALLAERGLVVAERMGALLFPYWGVPGIDGIVRHLIDEDPDVVEMLRDMGTKIDPRHAYCFVLRAEKKG
jgi:SAM-dependent methyltransferase